MTIIIDILKESWTIYLDVAVYMLFGFFIAGVLYVFFKADKIKQFLGTGNVRPVFLSALFGIPIPLCSCGVVPVAAGLKKQGANSGAALAFMIATPESGVDSIAVSWAMLDPIMTLIRPVSGFITAVATGLVQNFFGTQSNGTQSQPVVTAACGCGCTSGCSIPLEKSSWFEKFKAGMLYAYGELLSDIARPFFVGILIAGVITFFFPDDLSQWSGHHPFLSMLVMLTAGIPMYVCATSSTPIAAALILKGLNPGAALVFLLAGPATNAATITIVKSLFNKRALVIYLVMITVCSLAMGCLLDWIYSISGITASAVVGQAGQIIPESVRTGSAVILLLLLCFNIILQMKKPADKPNDTPNLKTI